jgi:hypothetical protein
MRSCPSFVSSAILLARLHRVRDALHLLSELQQRFDDATWDESSAGAKPTVVSRSATRRPRPPANRATAAADRALDSIRGTNNHHGASLSGYEISL